MNSTYFAVAVPFSFLHLVFSIAVVVVFFFCHWPKIVFTKTTDFPLMLTMRPPYILFGSYSISTRTQVGGCASYFMKNLHTNCVVVCLLSVWHAFGYGKPHQRIAQITIDFKNIQIIYVSVVLRLKFQIVFIRLSFFLLLLLMHSVTLPLFVTVILMTEARNDTSPIYNAIKKNQQIFSVANLC